MTRRIVNRIQDIYSIRIKKSFILLVFLITSFSIAEAKTLYVDGSSGNDTYTRDENDSTHRWLTLSRACQLAVAGDNVLVYAGTYSAPAHDDQSPPAFNPSNSGTSESNRITFTAVGTVNLTISGPLTGAVYGAAGRSYITWDGFSADENDHPMRTSEPNLVDITNSHYITIKNGKFRGLTSVFTGSGANRNAIWVNDATHVHIYNNIFNGFQGPDQNNAAIYFYGVTDTIVEHNSFDNGAMFLFSKGNGSIVGVTARNIIRYNLIRRFSGPGMRIGPSSLNSQIYQNILFDCTRAQFGWGSEQNNNGIQMDSWSADAANNTIYNNTIVSCVKGHRLHQMAAPNTFKNNLVVDIYSAGSTSGSAYYSSTNGAPAANISINYNVYDNVVPCYFTDDAGSCFSWATWRGTYGKDLNSINGASPIFVDKANKDFHLAPNSPARTASDTGGPVGAYITGNEIIGLTSTPIGGTKVPSAQHIQSVN